MNRGQQICNSRPEAARRKKACSKIEANLRLRRRSKLDNKIDKKSKESPRMLKNKNLEFSSSENESPRFFTSKQQIELVNFESQPIARRRTFPEKENFEKSEISGKIKKSFSQKFAGKESHFLRRISTDGQICKSNELQTNFIQEIKDSKFVGEKSNQKIVNREMFTSANKKRSSSAPCTPVFKIKCAKEKCTRNLLADRKALAEKSLKEETRKLRKIRSIGLRISRSGEVAICSSDSIIEDRIIERASLENVGTSENNIEKFPLTENREVEEEEQKKTVNCDLCGNKEAKEDENEISEMGNEENLTATNKENSRFEKRSPAEKTVAEKNLDEKNSFEQNFIKKENSPEINSARERNSAKGKNWPKKNSARNENLVEINLSEKNLVKEEKGAEIKSPDKKSAREGKSPKIHSAREENTTEKNSGRDGKSPEINSGRDGKSPEINSARDRKLPEQSSAREGKSPEKNSTILDPIPESRKSKIEISEKNDSNVEISGKEKTNVETIKNVCSIVGEKKKEKSPRKPPKKRAFKWETILEKQHRQFVAKSPENRKNSPEIVRDTKFNFWADKNCSKFCRCPKSRGKSLENRKLDRYSLIREELPKILMKRRANENEGRKPNFSSLERPKFHNSRFNSIFVENVAKHYDCGNNSGFVGSGQQISSNIFDNFDSKFENRENPHKFFLEAKKIEPMSEMIDSVGKSEDNREKGRNKVPKASILKHRSPRRVTFRLPGRIIDGNLENEDANFVGNLEKNERFETNVGIEKGEENSGREKMRMHDRLLENCIEEKARRFRSENVLNTAGKGDNNGCESEDSEQDWETPTGEDVYRVSRDVSFPKETREAMKILLRARENTPKHYCHKRITDREVFWANNSLSKAANSPEKNLTIVSKSYAKALAKFQEGCNPRVNENCSRMPTQLIRGARKANEAGGK